MRFTTAIDVIAFASAFDQRDRPCRGDAVPLLPPSGTATGSPRSATTDRILGQWWICAQRSSATDWRGGSFMRP